MLTPPQPRSLKYRRFIVVAERFNSQLPVHLRQWRPRIKATASRHDQYLFGYAFRLNGNDVYARRTRSRWWLKSLVEIFLCHCAVCECRRSRTKILPMILATADHKYRRDANLSPPVYSQRRKRRCRQRSARSLAISPPLNKPRAWSSTFQASPSFCHETIPSAALKSPTQPDATLNASTPRRFRVSST